MTGKNGAENAGQKCRPDFPTMESTRDAMRKLGEAAERAGGSMRAFVDAGRAVPGDCANCKAPRYCQVNGCVGGFPAVRSSDKLLEAVQRDRERREVLRSMNGGGA